MYVAHVVQRYLPAPLTGSEIYMRRISEGLVEKGHRVVILTSNAYDLMALRNRIQGRLLPIGISKANDVEVVRFRVHSYFSTIAGILHKIFHVFPFRSLNDALATVALGPIMPGLYFHLLREDYDLVHATPQPLANVLMAWLATRKRLPFVCTPQFHFELPYYYNEVFRMILRCSDAVIACTYVEKGKLIEFGIPQTKVHIVPRGINPKEYETFSSNNFRERHHLEDALIVLYAGTKAYDKGSIHLLKAMEIVQRRRKDAVLVSIGLSTPEWEKCKRELFGRVNVIDLGFVSEEEKRKAFNTCDVFVMPSRAEAFGIAYLEAWACGKPVIGARCGAAQEIIKDGVNGYLVRFGDIGELACKILLLLESNSLREKMGSDGRNKVVQDYTWSKAVERIENIYEKVLEAE